MDIKKWIKEHELFKFSSACKLVGLDAGNMHRKLNNEAPFTDIEVTALTPIINQYGFKEEKIDLSEKKTQFPQEQKITLDVIKDRCPKELTGLDRSAWISEERTKYGV